MNRRKPAGGPGIQSLLLIPVLMLAPGLVRAQHAEMRQIIDRLERLEKENQALREEIKALQGDVRKLQPVDRQPLQALEEKVAIHEERIKEHAQTKVESSQHFPIRVTGMALFNAFLNSRNSGGAENPLVAAPVAGSTRGGGTLRQSVVGFQYEGPGTAWGGKVRGSLFMDFFGGTSTSLNNLMRIRTGSIEIDWKNSSLLAGQEKPIFSPREPNSLAQVGVSPLSRSGNLWRWQPQVRFEQHVALGQASSLRAQVGVLQTSERPYPSEEYAPTDEARRPALQGRFEISRRIDDTRRLEIAPGFHASTSHVSGASVASNLFSLDWFANPWRRLEFTGAFFSGQNVSHFGAPNNGYTVLPAGTVIPVHGRGGWGQFTFIVTDRLSFNAYAGQHDDRNADLIGDSIGKNLGAAANIMYRLAPNVLVSLEALQMRTSYLLSGTRINNHYDLALAYQF